MKDLARTSNTISTRSNTVSKIGHVSAIAGVGTLATLTLGALLPFGVIFYAVVLIAVGAFLSK